jgi:RNA ligase
MLNRTDLEKLIQEGYVIAQKHPQADLWIYNYSQKTQYEGYWNEITLHCRGLILNKEHKVIARPFRKFFNLSEHQPEEIPNLSFEVFDKLDGSLGILYWHNEKPYLATRGSFNSEQSIKATEILYSRYTHTFDKLQPEKTYLFEIIYPANRIVVDYGAMEDLVLLAVIDNATGREEELQDIGFQKVKSYNGITDIAELKKLETDNAEGFVVRFKNDFRVKLKFAEYVRLHRILTGFSNVMVWEYLAESKPFDELLEKVPDEFYEWLKNTEKTLR